jgi:transaldolase
MPVTNSIYAENRGVQMVVANDLKVKVFADGADLDGIRQLTSNPLVKGYTTNPTLMKQVGITDYLAFSKEVLQVINGAPISLEVFSDEFDEMKTQALKLAALGENVYVKIPVTNTRAESSTEIVRELSSEGVKLNVTAIFTTQQVEKVVNALSGGPASYVSVFAGRIADAGVDPIPTMVKTLEIMRTHPQMELIWASPRELLNVVQAHEIGCHVITVTHDLLKKLPSLGKDLDTFSLETVKMFANDAISAGYSL